jgi:hypothetical protein
MQLKPVLGLLPVAVYGYPTYFSAVRTIAAPETAGRALDDELTELGCGELDVGEFAARLLAVEELAGGGPAGDWLAGLELMGVAANAFATGGAPHPVVNTRLRASSGFLIRDLQVIFWSHRGPNYHAIGTAWAQHAKRKYNLPGD